MTEALRVELRPRSLLSSMDLALAFLGQEGRCLAPLAAAALISSGLITLLWPEQPFMRWSAVVLVTPLFERVSTALLGGRLVGAEVSTASALRRVFARPLSTLAACHFPMAPLLMMLLGLATGQPASEKAEVLIGFGLLLGIIWPLLLARFTLIGTSAVLEGHHFRRAIVRSTLLTARHFGRLVGFLFLCFAVRVAIVSVAHMGFTFLWSFVLQLGPVPGFGGDGEATFFDHAAWILGGVVVANLRLFEYVSARIETDAWDLQVRFRALASRPRGRATP